MNSSAVPGWLDSKASLIFGRNSSSPSRVQTFRVTASPDVDPPGTAEAPVAELDPAGSLPGAVLGEQAAIMTAATRTLRRRPLTSIARVSSMPHADQRASGR